MSFQTADLFRRIENIISIGTLSQIDDEQNLARVKIGELETNWLPLPAVIGNNFIASTPAKIGTQAVVLSPSGDLAQGVITNLLFSDAHLSPNTDKNMDIIKFNDGSKIEYNSATGTLDIIASDVLKINVGGHASLTVGGDLKAHVVGDLNAKADGNIELDGSEVNLKKGGQGVVTAQCICAFTGAPHPDASLTVKASK